MHIEKELSARVRKVGSDLKERFMRDIDDVLQVLMEPSTYR